MKPCPKCWGTGLTKDHAALGRIARQVRQKRGLTLKQAALRLGIDPSHLSYLEAGKRSWSKDLYFKATT